MNKQVIKINDMPKGWTTKSKLNQKIYYAWKAMIERTTEKYWKKHPTYQDTTVDESWRTLSNFVEDIKLLPGYDKWSNSFGERMMLDKDTIVRGNKHYSKETCCFISHKDSNIDVHKRHPEIQRNAVIANANKHSIPLRLTNKHTGEVKVYQSIKDACCQLNLNKSHVWMIISDRYPGHHSTKGWIVERT